MKIALTFLLSASLLAQEGIAFPKEKAPEEKEEVFVPKKKREWTFHNFASLAYRVDRQKWTDPLIKMKIQSRQTAEVIVGSFVEVNHIVCQIRGQYGWLLDGKELYTALHQGENAPFFSDTFRIKGGYTADAMGALGLRFGLELHKNCHFSFIPSGGYKYSHMENFASGNKRSFSTSPVSASGFTDLSLSEPNQQDWFGPYFEARADFHLWKKLHVEFYYQFQSLALRSKLKDSFTSAFFSPDSVVLGKTNTVYKSRVNHGNLGGFHLRYHAPSSWSLGVYLEGSIINSGNQTVSMKTVSQEVLSSSIVDSNLTQKGKVYWSSYLVSAFLGKTF